MDTADRLALHELPVRYGDMVDDSDYAGLASIFTEDATFDLNSRVLDGLAEIQHYMEHEARHPRSHVITSIRVDDRGDPVVLHSRVVSIRPTGITNGRYRDEVVKGPDGWRVARRTFRSA